MIEIINIKLCYGSPPLGELNVEMKSQLSVFR